MLEKRVAIVTGAGQGLGEAISYKVAGLKALVALVDISDKIYGVQERIQRMGAVTEAFRCDIRDVSSIHSTVSNILQAFGRVDILVNNAGIWTDEVLEQERPLLRRLALDVNTLGTIVFTKAVLPLFEQRGAGHVVNIISVAGIPDSVASSNRKAQTYGASKWAVTGYTNALQEAVAGTGIKVTGLYPGGMDTNFYESAGKENTHNQPWMMNPDDVAEAVVFVLTRPSDVLIEKLVIRRNN